MTKVYTRDECLTKAEQAIAQIRRDRLSADHLVFAASREWIRRAEYAHLNGGSIAESDFENVSEYLDSIA